MATTPELVVELVVALVENDVEDAVLVDVEVLRDMLLELEVFEVGLVVWLPVTVKVVDVVEDEKLLEIVVVVVRVRVTVVVRVRVTVVVRVRVTVVRVRVVDGVEDVMVDVTVDRVCVDVGEVDIVDDEEEEDVVMCAQ